MNFKEQIEISGAMHELGFSQADTATEVNRRRFREHTHTFPNGVCDCGKVRPLPEPMTVCSKCGQYSEAPYFHCAECGDCKTGSNHACPFADPESDPSTYGERAGWQEPDDREDA